MEEILETSSYFIDRSQDVLEVLTVRMARLENNEETPTELPAKDQQALKRDYDLLEFDINTVEDFKKAVKKTKGACIEFFRRLLITYNQCQIEASRGLMLSRTTTHLWSCCRRDIRRRKLKYNILNPWMSRS